MVNRRPNVIGLVVLWQPSTGAHYTTGLDLIYLLDVSEVQTEALLIVRPFYSLRGISSCGLLCRICQKRLSSIFHFIGKNC